MKLYKCVQTKDYRQIEKFNKKEQENIEKYSYDYSQTFRNELNFNVTKILQPRTGCDTRSITQRIAASLNSEFSFFHTSCRSQAKKLILSNYLPIHRRNISIYAFLNGNSILLRPEFVLS